MTPHYRERNLEAEKEIRDNARRRSVFALKRIREQVHARPVHTPEGVDDDDDEGQRTFGGDRLPRKRRMTVAELED